MPRLPELSSSTSLRHGWRQVASFAPDCAASAEKHLWNLVIWLGFEAVTVLNPHSIAVSDDEVTQVSLRFEFETNFLEHYIASLTVLSQLPLQIAISAIFPLAGISLFLVRIVTHTLGLFDAIIIGLCLGFTPLITALNVWLYRRSNKTSVGRFVYEFDPYGMRVSGGAFDLKLKWEAIFKVRETRKFFLFFISARMAQFLPKRCIVDAEQLSQLRQFILSKTAK